VATDSARELAHKAELDAARNVLGQCDALRRLLACPHCGVSLGKVRFRRYTQPADFEGYGGGALAAT
jgi:hypothetical protein